MDIIENELLTKGTSILKRCLHPERRLKLVCQKDIDADEGGETTLRSTRESQTCSWMSVSKMFRQRTAIGCLLLQVLEARESEERI